MFGKKETEDKKPYAPGSTTLISQGTMISGDIHFDGNLEIEGKINGNIIADSDTARVRLLSQGIVEGEIRVANIVVNGHVKGNIYASKQVQLASKAVVEGNVHYEVIEIEKGAQIDGSFVHHQVKTAPPAKKIAPASDVGAEKKAD